MIPRILALIFISAATAVAAPPIDVTVAQLGTTPFDYKDRPLRLPAVESVKQLSESEYRIDFGWKERRVYAILSPKDLQSIAKNPKAPLYGGIQRIDETEVKIIVLGNSYVMGRPTDPPSARWLP